MLERRLKVTLFGESAWIATGGRRDPAQTSLELHFAFRSSAGDAAGVVAVQTEALDKDYLRRWARDLAVADEVERLLSGEIKPKNT